MSTKLKIVFLLTASILIGVYFVYYFVLVPEQNSQKDFTQKLYKSYAQSISLEIREIYNNRRIDEIHRYIKKLSGSSEQIRKISIIDQSSRIRISTEGKEIGSYISNTGNIQKNFREALKEHKVKTEEIETKEKMRTYRVFLPLNSVPNGYQPSDNPASAVLLIEFLFHRETSKNYFIKVILFVFAIIILPALTLVFALKRYYSDPIKKISGGINTVNKDNLDFAAEIKKRKDEITTLHTSFENMQQRLKDAFSELNSKISEITQKNTELHTLHLFTQKINNIMEIENLQESVVNFIIDEMDIDTAILLLWIQKDSAVVNIRKGIHKDIKRIYLDLTNPEEELTSPKTFLKKENLLEKIGISEKEVTSAKDENRSLFLILKQERQTIGILGLVKKNQELFTKEDMEIYSLVARNLSVCIHRALLYESAITDTFTGFYLRKYFEFLLVREIERAKRYDDNVSLLCLEIDNFENMIQTYSQYIGDLALKQVSSMIKSVFRKTDIFSRFSTNEFAIALPETDYDNALIISKRFQKNIQQLWLNIKESNIQIKINISIGISIFPFDGFEPEILIKKAEEALAKARSVAHSKIVFSKDIKS